MINSSPQKTFTFKQFRICAGQAGMPVSTDGVLLGSWAQFPQAHNLLDIGTGTGLLALMAAQRFPKLTITALDIDHHAYLAAQHNVDQSPWSARIRVLEQDLVDWQNGHRFDAIICNPPYFNHGQLSVNSQRATARHSHQLSHITLLKQCQRRLADDGCASFILPVVEGEAFIHDARQLGWRLTRCCRVAPNENKPTNRLLIELCLAARSTVLASTDSPEQSRLTIRTEDQYSAEFTALTKAFYLKL